MAFWNAAHRGKDSTMTIERFIQLWTHRYHKYTHIVKAHLKGRQARAHFRGVKRRLKKVRN